MFVFECEICRREVYAYYHADKPELDFALKCRCDGKERDAVLTPRKFYSNAGSPLPNHSRTSTASYYASRLSGLPCIRFTLLV